MKTKTQRRKKRGLLKVGFLLLNRGVLFIAASFMICIAVVGLIVLFETVNKSTQWIFVGGMVLFVITTLIEYSHD